MSTRLSEALLSELSELVATQTGLQFPKERYPDLERGIADAARELHLQDVVACGEWLLSTPLSRAEIAILADHLAIGETYFFRDVESFKMVEEAILPELIRSRRGGERRLRIWSAGCCTGEEPYSVAILLSRMIPDPSEWAVTLLATDISTRFLRRAQEARYGEWSFRATPSWVKECYFQRTPDRRYELVPNIRKMVTFSALNLVEDAYPSLANNTNAMDLVLCRNVLLYFSGERKRQVMLKLARSLVEGGWLMLSPSEIPFGSLPELDQVSIPGGVLRRKAAAPGPGSVAHRNDSGIIHDAIPAGEPLVLVEPEMSQPPSVDVIAPALQARTCANLGKLAEAASWCEKAIAADKLNASHRYLLGMILSELGRIDEAVGSLRRALYLDPNLVLAHFALGNLLLGLGRKRAAERHFRNALSILAGVPPRTLVPESEGLTAGRLSEAIRAALGEEVTDS